MLCETAWNLMGFATPSTGLWHDYYWNYQSEGPWIMNEYLFVVSVIITLIIMK